MLTCLHIWQSDWKSAICNCHVHTGDKYGCHSSVWELHFVLSTWSSAVCKNDNHILCPFIRCSSNQNEHLVALLETDSLWDICFSRPGAVLANQLRDMTWINWRIFWHQTVPPVLCSRGDLKHYGSARALKAQFTRKLKLPHDLLTLRGIVNPKMKILLSFTPQVVPKQYTFLGSAEHKGRYFEVSL